VGRKWGLGRRRIDTRAIASLVPTVLIVDVVNRLHHRHKQLIGVQHVPGGLVMCNACWEAYYAGYMSRTEVWQCVYYLDIIRSNRDELRRIPKRAPDDPEYCLHLGEGLLPFSFRSIGDEKDWYYLIYRPARRRRLYRLKTSGEGAERSRRESRRGVEDETNGWTKLYEF